MTKYIIDIDALINCCDFLTLGKLNGYNYTYVQNVKALIEEFPKDEVKESITVEINKQYQEV